MPKQLNLLLSLHAAVQGMPGCIIATTVFRMGTVWNVRYAMKASVRRCDCNLAQPAPSVPTVPYSIRVVHGWLRFHSV